MNDQQGKSCCEGDSLCSMIGEFYNRKNMGVVILTWVIGLASMAGAIYFAMMFCKAEETKSQIMYAVIFLVCMQFIGGIKIFAWQVIHRNRILREIGKIKG